MALADSYSKRCWACDERLSMAARYCSWCGEPQRTLTLRERLEDDDTPASRARRHRTGELKKELEGHQEAGVADRLRTHQLKSISDSVTVILDESQEAEPPQLRFEELGPVHYYHGQDSIWLPMRRGSGK